MYYPYGSAQQPQQEGHYQQHGQFAPPPTTTQWQGYQHNTQYGTSSTNTNTSNNSTNMFGAAGNGPQLQGQLYNPSYPTAQTNGVQGSSTNNYYSPSDHPTQQQQQQQYQYQYQYHQQQQQEHVASSSSPSQPLNNEQGRQQQATTSSLYYNNNTNLQSGGAYAANSQFSSGGLNSMGSQVMGYQQQQQQQQPDQRATPAPASGNNFAQKERNASPRGKCARPPPRRSVDLKSAPNPRRDISQKPELDEIRTSSGALPLSATGFLAIDDGNANPKFFRPTTSSVPGSEQLLRDSKLFFGAVLAPLCRPLDSREEVPVVEGRPPVRCNRCRGYISCHARFTDMGRMWVCPLCSMSNEVENDFFCNLDSSNTRLDIGQKVELSRGSVEYDVGAYTEYALRDEKDAIIVAKPTHYLFLLDVSQKANATFLSDYVDALLRSLHEMAQHHPQCRVAFITYATTLHFYNVRHPRIPQLVVADIDNPFVPLPFTSLCWLTLGTELDLVDAFLLRVPEYAEDINETDSVMGAAVQIATLVLAGQHGSHIVLCGHKAPQRGIGAVKLREQHVLYGTDREKELLRPQDGFWKNMAIACAKQHISFDLHMFADDYCELVTLMQPSHLSNGSVHLFSNYDRETDATKVQAALDQLLLEEAGYAGVLRVRCSDGLRVQNYRGHFLAQDSHDMDLAHIRGSSTFFVEFAHEEKLEKTSSVYFQVALLYTTRAGQRRVRVHSVRMPVVSTLSSVFEADLEATLMGYIHEAVGNAVNKGLKHARSFAQERILKMLIAYRRVCTSTTTSSLLMPSRLRILPLYVLCLLKADALVEGTTVRIDDRVQKLFQLMTIPMHKCLGYLYPTLYAVHNLLADPKCGVLDAETGRCVMPALRQLIFDSITTDGVYLLCDEQARHVYMWIGASVSPDVSMELFGTNNAVEVGRSVFFDNFHERLRNVLQSCLMHSDGMRRLIIFHENDRAEDVFFRQLKEEAEGGLRGYDDFLVYLHSEVNKAIK